MESFGFRFCSQRENVWLWFCIWMRIWLGFDSERQRNLTHIHMPWPCFVSIAKIQQRVLDYSVFISLFFRRKRKTHQFPFEIKFMGKFIEWDFICANSVTALHLETRKRNETNVWKDAAYTNDVRDICWHIVAVTAGRGNFHSVTVPGAYLMSTRFSIFLFAHLQQHTFTHPSPMDTAWPGRINNNSACTLLFSNLIFTHSYVFRICCTPQSIRHYSTSAIVQCKTRNSICTYSQAPLMSTIKQWFIDNNNIE